MFNKKQMHESTCNASTIDIIASERDGNIEKKNGGKYIEALCPAA